MHTGQDPGEARRRAEAAVARFHDAGDCWNEILACTTAAHACVDAGDLAGATNHLATRLDLVEEFGMTALVGFSLLNVACVAWQTGNRNAATDLVVRARHLIHDQPEDALVEMSRTMLRIVPLLLELAARTPCVPSDETREVLALARTVLVDATASRC